MFRRFRTYTPVKDRFQAQNRNDCSVKCRAGVRVNFWTFGLFIYTRTNNSELIQKCNSMRKRRARKLKQTCEPNRSKFYRFQRHKIICFIWRELELLDKIDRPISKKITSDNWRSNRDSLLDTGHRYFSSMGSSLFIPYPRRKFTVHQCTKDASKKIVPISRHSPFLQRTLY
jgi:hypothetical protein